MYVSLYGLFPFCQVEFLWMLSGTFASHLGRRILDVSYIYTSDRCVEYSRNNQERPSLVIFLGELNFRAVTRRVVLTNQLTIEMQVVRIACLVAVAVGVGVGVTGNEITPSIVAPLSQPYSQFMHTTRHYVFKESCAELDYPNPEQCPMGFHIWDIIYS